ncbi:right-handed parallel beta-helix repeat-containing protein [Lewinella sp. W8]|uniref:right-handed parallel beta-helix repeat-containing protein n=1 Tax=Lewinella sp. W8 TaxID=2528208 RepID=UPI0010682953|nr:right-handed parallel beta-helix repeat-containing protein [Lewinella sp. W8]MTB51792.1 hypothetical protein [Lewinella sp. W8]
MNSLRPLLYLMALCCTLVMACEVETEFVTGEQVELRFSTDTVTFDTVFTARGSATRSFKVYNDGEQPVKIDRVRVGQSSGVNFIFNVDGFQGPEAEDVIIWGEDSIFIFVEVFVDPTDPEEVSPFIVEDALIFETGNAVEEVTLIAFGQNANYINGFNRGEFFRITCDNGVAVLPQELPTVVYGSMFIDSCVVQALPGTRLYLHGGVQRNELIGGSGIFNDGFIFTQPDGSLQLLGTLENPVIVQTDRLEEEFADDPAKYRGLILGPGSENNVLENAQLLNAIVGITIDSAAEVRVENSIIAFSGGPAISAYQSDVTVRNSLFHSNFGNTVQFVKGGTLRMQHTTIANYGVDASGLVLTNFDCDENGENCVFSPMVARLENSIVSGSRASEIILVDIFQGEEPTTFDVQIDNSVVRTDSRFLTDQNGLYADFYETICQNCVNLEFSDPLFVSIEEDDYALDSLSVARNLGVFLPALPQDLRGNQRDTESPDAGALEWQPQ